MRRETCSGAGGDMANRSPLSRNGLGRTCHLSSLMLKPVIILLHAAILLCRDMQRAYFHRPGAEGLGIGGL